MNILEKRPLGLILCVILSGFSLFALISPLMRAISIAFALSFCVLTFVIKRKSTLLKIAAISLLLSFVASFLYFDVYFYPTDLYGKETEFTARVLDVEKQNDNSQSIEIKTLTVNSEKKGLKLRLNLYGSYEEIKPGHIISFKTELKELRDSEGFNFRKYYTSRGVCATADIAYFNVEYVGKEPLSYKFKEIRESISRRAESLSNEKAGSMLSALLLGERERLSGQLNLDFARTGITHILALSGTHVVILAAAVDKILSVLRVGRKYRLLTGSVFTLLFMALTGFPLSVCRAGIMLILSTILFLFTGCKDSVTSLLLASALIILFSPYASQDVGLWLSILATGGLLVYAELLNEKYSYEADGRKFLRYVALSFAYSFFAISATVIVTTLSFTGNSVLAVLSTFLFSILTELYVYLGIGMLVFGKLIPIGKLLILFEQLISFAVGWFSDFSFAFSSDEFIIVKIAFIALGLSFAVFAFAPINRKRVFLSYLTVLFIFANIMPIGLTYQVKYSDTLTFASDTYDKIFIRDSGKSLLIDISNSSKNAAYDNNYLLISEKTTELDTYLVVNYYETLPDSIDKILSNNLVKEVRLPKPSSDFQNDVASSVYERMQNYRARLSFYEDFESMSLCGFEIMIPFRKDNMVAILLQRNGEIYSYLSKGILEYISESEQLLYVSDYVVFGSYGKEYTSTKLIDEFDKRLKAVVSFDSRIDFDLSGSVWQPPKLYLAKNKFYFYK